MLVEYKFTKDFERTVEALREKYGEDFEILNGVHASQLNASEFIDAFVDKNLSDVTIDNNANVFSKDIASLRSEKGKSIDKLIAANKIFYEIKKKYGLKTAKEWLEAEWVGAYYLHDFSTTSYMPYCYAYDLSRLAKEGLFFLSNYNNEPPQHLTTFVDDLIEFISFMSNRSSGAVGIPNVLVWMMYFWKKDVNTGYAIKNAEYHLQQACQKLIYRLNQPFMRIDQSAFVNVSIFDKYYYESLFGGVEFSDGSFAIDMVDDFMYVQKTFMEVVSDIRHKNMFTFPVLTYSLLKRDDITKEEAEEMLRTRNFNVFKDNEFARWCSDHNCQWNDSNFFMSKDTTTLSNCCFDGDQEFYYYDSTGDKYLTTFKNYVEERVNKKYFGNQIINTVENEYIDAPDGSKQKVVAVSKLPNMHKKLIEIELEDGRMLRVTPDQKIFDNNTKSLVAAKDILTNPEKFDI